MARADMNFSGRVANLIYYKMYGKTFVRAAPVRVRQTKATKASGLSFGLASRLGSAIRNQLFTVIPDPKDHQMQVRLVSAVYQRLKAAGGNPAGLADRPDLIKGFSFIEKTRYFRHRWKVGIQVINPSSGLVQVKIPAFIPADVMEAPKDTTSVTCKFAAGVSDVKTGMSLGSAAFEFNLTYNNEPVAEQTISFKLPTPEGSLIVTGASLQYKINNGRYMMINTNKNFLPAEILDAKYITSLNLKDPS